MLKANGKPILAYMDICYGTKRINGVSGIFWLNDVNVSYDLRKRSLYFGCVTWYLTRKDTCTHNRDIINPIPAHDIRPPYGNPRKEEFSYDTTYDYYY